MYMPISLPALTRTNTIYLAIAVLGLVIVYSGFVKFEGFTTVNTAHGSYANSCYNCTDKDGILSGCKCKNRRGNLITSRPFKYTDCKNGVDNIKGQLSCTPVTAHGSYANSCSNCKDNNGTLSGCRCKNREGYIRWPQPFKYVDCKNGVDNINGELRCAK